MIHNFKRKGVIYHESVKSWGGAVWSTICKKGGHFVKIDRSGYRETIGEIRWMSGKLQMQVSDSGKIKDH